MLARDNEDEYEIDKDKDDESNEDEKGDTSTSPNSAPAWWPIQTKLLSTINKVWTCIGKMGTDSVKIDAGGNDKECLTFSPTISASGKKLSTVVVKAGKTQRSFANLNILPQTVTHLNSTGWSDVDMVKKIIDGAATDCKPQSSVGFRP